MKTRLWRGTGCSNSPNLPRVSQAMNHTFKDNFDSEHRPFKWTHSHREPTYPTQARFRRTLTAQRHHLVIKAHSHSSLEVLLFLSIPHTTLQLGNTYSGNLRLTHYSVLVCKSIFMNAVLGYWQGLASWLTDLGHGHRYLPDLYSIDGSSQWHTYDFSMASIPFLHSINTLSPWHQYPFSMASTLFPSVIITLPLLH